MAEKETVNEENTAFAEEDAAFAEENAAFAEQAQSAAEEDTEAVTEESAETDETATAEQPEPEVSTEVESEEKTEQAASTQDETALTGQAQSAAEEDTEAVTEESAETDETATAEQSEPEVSTEVESQEKAMVRGRTKFESEVIESSTISFKTFCGDITGMFGVKMNCRQTEICDEDIEGLKKRFDKVVAINSVKAEGTLEGTFQLIFDRAGLFILAGLITMPEQMTSLLEKCVGPAKIQKNIESGSLKEAEDVRDAIAEAGNLLVGAWNKVFREGLEGHGHFAQADTFIGKVWSAIGEKTGLVSDEKLLFIAYKIAVGSYPAFNCGVIFPRTVFAGAEEKARIEAEAKAKAEAEEEARIEAEKKAKAETEAKVRAEAEAEAKAKAEAAEKLSNENEGATKKDLEAAAEQKSNDIETDGSANVVEEKATTAEVDDSKEKPVSEAIQRMAESPAVLPGESASSAVPENPAVGSTNISLVVCAKEIMQKDIIWGSGDDSIQQTLTKMQQHNVGYMMVGQNGVLEGIASKSNLTGAISPYLRPIFAKWRRPLDDSTLQIKIKWIMSRPVRTVKPDTSLAAIMENMCQFGQRALPVIDQQGKVQGLVTVFDIFQALLNNNTTSTVGKTLQTPPSA